MQASSVIYESLDLAQGDWYLQPCFGTVFYEIACSLSSLSWVFPGVSSLLDMPETPPYGGIQGLSLPDVQKPVVAPLDVEEQLLFSEPLPDN